MTAALCECGCGQQPRAGYRYLSGHRADHLAIVRVHGALDARNGRDRRVDIADISELGAAYTRGYDNPWRYQ